MADTDVDGRKLQLVRDSYWACTFNTREPSISKVAMHYRRRKAMTLHNWIVNTLILAGHWPRLLERVRAMERVDELASHDRQARKRARKEQAAEKARAVCAALKGDGCGPAAAAAVAAPAAAAVAAPGFSKAEAVDIVSGTASCSGASRESGGDRESATSGEEDEEDDEEEEDEEETGQSAVADRPLGPDVY